MAEKAMAAFSRIMHLVTQHTLFGNGLSNLGVALASKYPISQSNPKHLWDVLVQKVPSAVTSPHNVQGLLLMFWCQISQGTFRSVIDHCFGRSELFWLVLVFKL